jgi:Chitobiase/beta-hexosaminidase C-terminal domain/Legume lectin domain
VRDPEIRNRCASSAAIGIFLLTSLSARAQVNVTTWHNDLARSGVNSQETILTTANVNVSTFGKLFSVPVDGQVYAQPLVLSGVSIDGGTHNVVYIATEHDSVYAIDADTGATYANVSLIPAGGTTVNSTSDLTPACGDIQPEVGITGTPVIDPSSNTLYVVAKSKVNGNIVQFLHALNAGTLAENAGSPVEIQASVPGKANDGDGTQVAFNPITENQRPGLALDNGHVLISWASHCDHTPYHGWLISYNAQTLEQDAAWNATPNGDPNGTLSLAGIWMSGAAPAIDANGNIFLATGNGYQNGTTDFGDSVVKLGLPANGTFPVLDYFVPFNENGSQTQGDTDLGSGGVLLLPKATNGAQLLAQAGKAGTLHLLDQNNLGKSCLVLSPACTTSDPQVPQEITGVGSIFSTPAFWNGNIYWNASGNTAVTYSFDAGGSGQMSAAPVSQTASSLGTFARTDAASISANGLTEGIYWFMHNTGDLLAFDATNLATLLWDSGQNSGRDSPGAPTKFVPPTIANGRVYLGGSTAVVGYGLLNGQATTPTFFPATGTYAAAQIVTITDATPGATFFFTTDGSTPTTASTKYSGSVTVSGSETLQAIAVQSGLLTSAVGSASYSISGSSPPPPPPVTTALPTFSPGAGAYTMAQSVTITDATAGANIFFTTDGTTPTTASAAYTAPISVSASETLQAIATASGDSPSAIASAAYTINTTGNGGGGTAPPVVNDPNGFTSAANFTLDGGATVTGGALQLDDGNTFENRTVWYTTPLNIQSFTTDFTFQITPASPNTGDGFTFTIQNMGLNADGGIGGALGYQGITPSVAVKFDLFSNNGEGNNSTGFYTDGVAPTVPALDLTPSGINLHNANVVHAHLTYYGATLILTLTDTVTNATFMASEAIDIPSTVGKSTAYVGFTAGSGGSIGTEDILSWTYTPNAPTVTVTAQPTIAPEAGTYTGTQSVTLADATPGATIYYTTDGTTPTTASTVYSGPISVTASTTLNAIAIASGDTLSTVTSAVYTIEAPITGGGGTNPPLINNSNGFTGSTGFTFDGGATVTGGALQLSDGGNFENRSAWYATPVNVQNFNTSFMFQITPATPGASDGFTFTIQNMGLTADGGIGGALGYQGITPSVAVKFDLFSNDGEGVNSTGFYTNGVAPTVPALDLTPSGINLHSGDVMLAQLTYDGTTLTLTLTDTVTNATFTASDTINIPATVGMNTAFVGFTGGTGGTVSTQNILNWTYTVN